jgi:hypothetical protein
MPHLGFLNRQGLSPPLSLNFQACSFSGKSLDLESIGKEVEKQTSSRAASEKDTFLKRESM